MPAVDQQHEELTVIPGTVPSLINPPQGCRFANRCPYRFERCSEMPPLFNLDNGRQARCWLYEKAKQRSTLRSGRRLQ